MFRSVFLVDMTKHRGLEQSALRSVQAFASECDPELIDWFKQPHRAQPDLAKAGKVFSGLETGLQLWPRIRQRILELSSNGYAGCLFHMISYLPADLADFVLFAWLTGMRKNEIASLAWEDVDTECIRLGQRMPRAEPRD
jgi:integrase